MNAVLITSILALTSLVPGPHTTDLAPLPPDALDASAGELSAAGSFTQTGISSLEARTAGPVTILDQTSSGIVDGTLSGSFEDDLRVVILPNGRFMASFTLTVECTVDGRQGVLTLQAADVGQLADPTTGHFVGVAAITGATGELAGLHGVLEIQGVVDLPSGLSTYSYTGTLHTTW
jgi:hypothetical protein